MKKVGDWMSSDKFEQSLWRRINKTDSCWLWTGGTRFGYGRATRPHGSKGHVRDVMAHRFIYELLVGPIPAEMHLHHLCGIRLCVNPAHLQPVTRVEHAHITAKPVRLARLVAAYERVMGRYSQRLEGA